MAGKIPYFDRKEDIRATLLFLAQSGQTIFYSDLGKRLGIPARGPWKRILDELSREERRKGLPDLTYLVVSKTSGLPNQIEFESAKPPNTEQRSLAAEIQLQIFTYYRGLVL